MSNWQTRLNERKMQFLAKTRDKLVEVEQLLNVLRQVPNDAETLTRVNKHFHQLAGAGGIYEMSEFCNVGIAAEELCTKLLTNRSPVGDLEQQKLRALCEAMLREVDSEAKKAEAIQAAAAAQPSPQLGDGTDRKLDVLLVDGDQDRLISLHRLFEQNKFSVRTVRTASGAAGALLTRMPDALVINAPVSDSPFGLEILENLQGRPNAEKCSVIVIAERASFKTKVDAIKCGASSFIDGPAEAPDILVKVNELVGNKQPVQFRILSVEDDPEQAYFIKSTLESVGYSVLHIADPAEFEQAINSFAPHLVLLDIMLGEISGHDLARFVRKHEKYSKLPVVFLSTENQLNMHIESARVGGDDHLIKPIAPQLLIAAIAGRLERSGQVLSGL